MTIGDAFVGMTSERHLSGSEFGELQLAIWKKQFEALRDGDRFFYLNDPVLREIERNFGITYRRTLGEVIELNTGADVAPTSSTFGPPESPSGRRGIMAAAPRCVFREAVSSGRPCGSASRRRSSRRSTASPSPRPARWS
jgi:hypothetical protein